MEEKRIYARLSLNQATTEQWGMQETLEGCRRMGIPRIGLWRHRVAEKGTAATAAMVREAGLAISSLCRGGMFPAATAAERRARIDDNRRALDEAAALGANLLVLVCGPAADRDIDAARGQVEDGIAALIPEAEERGITLGIEPLNPMYAAQRSVIVTLGQANDLRERLASPQVGVVIDVYHVWWDPQVYTQIARATGHIVCFHVNDWLVPLGDPLLSRGMMGDGVIELERITRAVEATGYRGPIEVEIFNQALWDAPGEGLLAQIKDRYRSCIATGLSAD